MDQAFVIQHLVEIITGAGSLFLLAFRYRETISFAVKIGKASVVPFKWMVALIKMPFRINEQVGKSQNQLDALQNSFTDFSAFVKKELTFNGGTSTRDSIRRIENRLIEQEFAQNALLQDAEYGLFRTDLTGHNKWVNRTYARYLGCGTNELMGHSWKRFVRTDELRRYSQVWEAAFRDGCEFEDVVEFTNTDHDIVRLRIRAVPITDDKGHIFSYVGTVIPI